MLHVPSMEGLGVDGLARAGIVHAIAVGLEHLEYLPELMLDQ